MLILSLQKFSKTYKKTGKAVNFSIRKEPKPVIKKEEKPIVKPAKKRKAKKENTEVSRLIFLVLYQTSVI